MKNGTYQKKLPKKTINDLLEYAKKHQIPLDKENKPNDLDYSLSLTAIEEAMELARASKIKGFEFHMGLEAKKFFDQAIEDYTKFSD